MQSVRFSLAGLRFSLTSPRDDLPLRLPAEYAPFASDSATVLPVGAAYHISPGPGPQPNPVGPWLWQNEVWRMGHAPEDGLLIQIYDVKASAWRTAAHVLGDFARGALFVRNGATPDSTLVPFHHPHDRVILLGRLAFIGGGVVHASCVVADGKAMLFVGPSGAGKTTIARLWRDAGATILNDERNIVRTADPSPFAGSSPWHGEENQVSAVCAPLAAVFYLHKSEQNGIREVPCADSVTRLFTSTFVPVYLRDGPRMILDAWARILDGVPGYELNFTPDRRAVMTCRKALSL